jgi:peptide-methionine (S)-S-oxide reductase
MSEPDEKKAVNGHAIAVFGGGCFWCTEAVFKMLRGVVAVAPGYAGGSVPDPTYEQVSGGQTGHAEVIRIDYDPEIVSYRDLLTVFFASHDPTTLNRQGNDVGTQYRSIVLFTDEDQRSVAEAMISEINAAATEGAPVVTQVEPLKRFYPAEDYHRDYYANNRWAPYCLAVINPKLKKVKKQFAELLERQSK